MNGLRASSGEVANNYGKNVPSGTCEEIGFPISGRKNFAIRSNMSDCSASLSHFPRAGKSDFQFFHTFQTVSFPYSENLQIVVSQTSLVKEISENLPSIPSSPREGRCTGARDAAGVRPSVQETLDLLIINEHRSLDKTGR